MPYLIRFDCIWEYSGYNFVSLEKTLSLTLVCRLKYFYHLHTINHFPINIDAQFWKYLMYPVLDTEDKRIIFDIIQSALFLMILWRQAKERCWNVRAENRGTEYLRELTTRTSLYKHFLSSPQCIFCSSYCIRSINKFRYAINQP